MDQIRSNLKGVIGSSKSCINLSNLEDEYLRVTNSTLNYKEFNYPDLKSFIESMNDIIKLVFYRNAWVVHLVTTEDDPQCLKKLRTLIQHTKSKKQSNSHHNIPQNIMMKANNYNLKISVANDLYINNEKSFEALSYLKFCPSLDNVKHDEYRKNVQKNKFSNGPFLSKISNNFTNNSSIRNNNVEYRRELNNMYQNSVTNQLQFDNIRNNNYNTNGVKNNNDQTSYSKISHPKSNKQPEKVNDNHRLGINEKTNEARQQKILDGNGSKKVLDVPCLENDGIYKTSFSDETSVKNILNRDQQNQGESFRGHKNENNFEDNHFLPIRWPVNRIIDINVLHRPVKILGVLSGMALVAVLEKFEERQYLELKAFNSGLDGDILIWQPPIYDNHRNKSCIDTMSAFPVILLERLSCDVAKVRIMGLKIILRVKICDLYQFPKDKTRSKAFRKHYELRQVTFVCIAAIPIFLEIWDSEVLNGTYFSPQSTVDNKELIFERCDSRGDFLNVMLLIHFCSNEAFDSIILRSFVGQLIMQMENCKKALVPEFQNILRHHFESSDYELSQFQKNINNNPLMIFDNNVNLADEMLIGCPQLLDLYGKETISKSDQETFLKAHYEIVLERIVFNSKTKSFHYFDKNFQKVPIPTNCTFGLYIINRSYTGSRLADISKLRFQVSMLLHIPDYNKFLKISEK